MADVATVLCCTPGGLPRDPSCRVNRAGAYASFQCRACAQKTYACKYCFARFTAAALAHVSRHVKSNKTGDYLAHHTYGKFLVANNLAAKVRTVVCRCPCCLAGEMDLVRYPSYIDLLAALPRNKLPSPPKRGFGSQPPRPEPVPAPAPVHRAAN